MTPATTLTAYAAALAVVFGAAVGVGQLTGPVGTAASSEHGEGHGGSHGGGTDERVPATADALPGGLSTAQDGYALQLAGTNLTTGRAQRLQFGITGPDGELVTDFTPTHDKDLHLVVVRRDLTGFQHLHPTRDSQGTWSVPLELPQAGAYKVVADFQPAGRDEPLALGADLTAPGSFVPTPLPAPEATARPLGPDGKAGGDDDYAVTLRGRLVAGQSSRLVLSVAKAGRPVTDLEPYLAAYGHLVALRVGDLAYLHVHPDVDADAAGAGTPAGPEIAFDVDVPDAGPHRLFLDFAHGGVVRTVAFTAVAERLEAGHDSTGGNTDTSTGAGSAESHDH